VVERCPTCHGPLEDLAALAQDLATDGLTYPAVAALLGRSVKRVQRVVYEHGIKVRYGRVGRHPRRHAFLSLHAVREIRGYLSRPRPARTHPER
jgi:uncharacterized protein YwbE